MNERALAGQVAVITGGASGIGAAATRAIAEAGAAIAILDREVQGARRVAAEVEQLGGSAHVVAIELL